ncbi:MAG: endonuclease/exonuclease/phosphatase family protein [Candidatus Woesearchaeota archaeon]
MKLRIFSLNCWLLPFPLSTNNRGRLSNIISLVKKHKPDIIALQEVWLKNDVKYVEDSLKDYVFIKSSSRLFNKSGLLTGVLKKNVSYEIQSFPITKKHNLIERIARKGYHILKLSNDLFFVNTHLYAPMIKNEESIAKSQFTLLQKLMKSKKGFLVGDFNLDENELEKLNKRFELDKTYNITWSGSNKLTRTMFNRLFPPDKKKDYIFKTKKSNITLKTKCIESPIVSDHFAILIDGTIL